MTQSRFAPIQPRPSPLPLWPGFFGQAMLLLVVTAIFLAIASSLTSFGELFAAFGDQLPTTSQWLVDHPWQVSALLLALWVGQGILTGLRAADGRPLSRWGGWVVGAANLLLAAAIVAALYLPIISLSAVT